MSAAARHRRRRRSGGYTLIEVMMALAVLTAGAVGIVGMQQAAIRGNMISRQITTANNLAQLWIDRLQRDSIHWTNSSSTASVADLANTTYLKNVTAAGSTPAWFVPVPGTSIPEAAAFDYYGRDTTTAGAMYYCANIRLAWVYPGRAMRGDVRIWWARTSNQATTGLAACNGGAVAPTGNFNVRMVQASTVLRPVAL